MSADEDILAAKTGITGTGIKIIALVTMLIDHFAGIILDNYLEYKVPGYSDSNVAIDFSAFLVDGYAGIFALSTLLHLIGRFAFPLFIFLLIEGFVHTRSVKKYALNMLIFAAISQLPYNVVHEGRLFYFNTLNIFTTLLMGLLCMWCISELAEKKKWSDKLTFLYYISSILLGAYILWLLTKTTNIEAFKNMSLISMLIMCGVGAVIGLIVMLIVGRNFDSDTKNRFTFTVLPIIVIGVISYYIRVEYSVYGVMTIVVMYLLRDRSTTGFGLSVLMLNIYNLLELTAFFMIPVVSRYNGVRGMKINKYFFYLFYPVHLSILYIITLMLGWTTFSIM